MTDWLRTARAEFLPDLPLPRERPLPRIAVRLGPSVPGWALRLAAVVATGVLALSCVQRTAVEPWLGWTLVVASSLVMALWPSAVAALTTLVLSGLLLAVAGQGPLDPVVLVAMRLGYAATRLGWWAQRLTLDARVELAALARGWRRGVALVVAGWAGAGLLLLSPGPSAVLVMLGGVALVVLTWLVLTRRA